MKLETQLIDRTRALANLGGDTVFLAELAGILEAACPALLDDIRDALAHGNLSGAAWSARLLRVAAENVNASSVARAAHLTEALACQKQTRAAADAYDTLQNEVARLKAWHRPSGRHRYPIPRTSRKDRRRAPAVLSSESRGRPR